MLRLLIALQRCLLHVVLHVCLVADAFLVVELEHLNKLLLLLEVTLVNALRDGQLGAFVERHLAGVERLFGAMQEQDPLEEFTGRWLVAAAAREEDLELPEATRVLGPCVRGHEGPLVEAVLRVRIERALAQQQGSL